MRPSVGRTVHYVAYGTPNGEYSPEHRAAIVTEVTAPVENAVLEGQSHVIGLCVLNPMGMFFNTGVTYDPQCRPGTWHWPERVED